MFILLDGTATVTVDEGGVEVFVTLDRSAFLRQLASDPSFAFRLLELMAGRIRTLSGELARAKTR